MSDLTKRDGGSYMYKKRRKGKTLLIVSLIILLMIIVAFTAYLITSLKKQKNNSDATDMIYFRELSAEHIVIDIGTMGYVDDELLITAEIGTDREVVEKIAEKYDAEIVGEIPVSCVYQLMFSKKLSRERLEEIMAEVNDMPGIMYADLNRVFPSTGMSVTYDPNMGSDWPDETKARWGFNAVNTRGAWNILNGNKDIIEPIKVGIVDTGFYLSNDDLVFAEEPFCNVGHNHGTGCAGVFAANGNNDEGICGIYPYGEGMLYGASCFGVTALHDPNTNYISSLVDVTCFSNVISKGAKVINYSYGDHISCGAIEIYKDNEVKDEFEAGMRFVASSLINLRSAGYDFVIVTASGNMCDDNYLRLSENEDGTFSVDNKKGNVYGCDGENINVTGDKTKYYYYKHPLGCTACDNEYFVGHVIDKVKKSDLKNKSDMGSDYTSFINCISPERAPAGREEEYRDLYDRIIVTGALIFSYDENSEAKAGEYDWFKNIDYRPSVLSAADFSNRGDRVDVYAPGVLIRNTTENGYGYSHGTSEAAPIVSGIAAMMWTANNDLRGDQVKSILLRHTLPTSENDKKIPDAGAAVLEAIKTNPKYVRDEPEQEEEKPYKWALLPSVDAEDIIVYNLDEVGYDHSIFNDLAYIKQKGKYGIIDYDGIFLAECTTDGYLSTAAALRQLAAGGIVLESGNGNYVRLSTSGGVGGGYVYRYYSEKDKATYRAYGIDDRVGRFYRIDEQEDYVGNELNPVKTAELHKSAEKNRNSSYKVYSVDESTISEGWGISKGNELIVECEYDEVIVPYYNTRFTNLFNYCDISALSKNGKWCYVDGNGKKLTGFDYIPCTAWSPADVSDGGTIWGTENIIYPFLPTEGYIAVKTDEGAGFIDISGNEVIPAGTFAETRPVHNGKAWVKEKDTELWGVVELEQSDDTSSEKTTVGNNGGRVSIFNNELDKKAIYLSDNDYVLWTDRLDNIFIFRLFHEFSGRNSIWEYPFPLVQKLPDFMEGNTYELNEIRCSNEQLARGKGTLTVNPDGSLDFNATIPESADVTDNNYKEYSVHFEKAKENQTIYGCIDTTGIPESDLKSISVIVKKYDVSFSLNKLNDTEFCGIFPEGEYEMYCTYNGSKYGSNKRFKFNINGYEDGLESIKFKVDEDAVITFKDDSPLPPSELSPEEESFFIGLWKGKSYYGDGRDVTREILRSMSEYDEEEYTSLSEMYEIDIHSDHTATVYARKRRKEEVYKWTVSGKNIVLLGTEDDEDNIILEKKDASTVKMTFGDDDKYILLEK